MADQNPSSGNPRPGNGNGGAHANGGATQGSGPSRPAASSNAPSSSVPRPANPQTAQNPSATQRPSAPSSSKPPAPKPLTSVQKPLPSVSKPSAPPAPSLSLSSGPSSPPPPAPSHPLEEAVPPPPPMASPQAVHQVPALPQVPTPRDEELLSRKSQIDALLHELHLTRRHLYTFLGCGFLLIIVVVAGIYLFTYFLDDDPAANGTDVPNTTNQAEETGIPAAALIGEEASEASSMSSVEAGIDAAINLGTSAEKPTPIRTYLITLRQMQNAYQTDIAVILDQTVDRSGVIDNHLTILNHLLREGQRIKIILDVELATLEEPFTLSENQKTQAEESFFGAVDALDPVLAEESLDTFVENSQEAIAVRARYRALQRIAEFYEQALPRMQARIDDVELNREALSKGIQVFDVRGSDLELIITE